jgi:hypothetical protein
MTGSALAPVVIPIVAFAFLFLWIGMVFYANAHPSVHGRQTQAPGGEREPGVHRGDSNDELERDRPGSDRRAA